MCPCSNIPRSAGLSETDESYDHKASSAAIILPANLLEKDAPRGLFERLIIGLIRLLEACRLRNSLGHMPSRSSMWRIYTLQEQITKMAYLNAKFFKKVGEIYLNCLDTI